MPQVLQLSFESELTKIANWKLRAAEALVGAVPGAAIGYGTTSDKDRKVGKSEALGAGIGALSGALAGLGGSAAIRHMRGASAWGDLVESGAKKVEQDEKLIRALKQQHAQHGSQVSSVRDAVTQERSRLSQELAPLRGEIAGLSDDAARRQSDVTRLRGSDVFRHEHQLERDIRARETTVAKLNERIQQLRNDRRLFREVGDRHNLGQTNDMLAEYMQDRAHFRTLIGEGHQALSDLRNSRTYTNAAGGIQGAESQYAEVLRRQGHVHAQEAEVRRGADEVMAQLSTQQQAHERQQSALGSEVRQAQEALDKLLKGLPGTTESVPEEVRRRRQAAQAPFDKKLFGLI